MRRCCYFFLFILVFTLTNPVLANKSGLEARYNIKVKEDHFNVKAEVTNISQNEVIIAFEKLFDCVEDLKFYNKDDEELDVSILDKGVYKVNLTGSKDIIMYYNYSDSLIKTFRLKIEELPDVWDLLTTYPIDEDGYILVDTYESLLSAGNHDRYTLSVRNNRLALVSLRMRSIRSVILNLGCDSMGDNKFALLGNLDKQEADIVGIVNNNIKTNYSRGNYNVD